jgi:hypothetical protein
MVEQSDLVQDQDFQAGDRVRLMNPLPYIKTADPMPMLRPPNVVTVGEEGTIVDRRPGGYWGVRFNKGIFLMESRNLERIDADAAVEETDEGQRDDRDDRDDEDNP